jgi:hypothetical protein
MKKIISIGILFFVLIAFSGVTSASSVSHLKVPTKYKTYTATNHYYESGSSYYNGEYIWESKNHNLNNPTIHEKYGGSQTKIQFYTYNNNGNKYHWMDVRSSQLTVKYKIKTSTKTYYASKTVKYTKIPKYGMTKTLILKGPAGSHVLIYYMKWTQVGRNWDNWK